MKTIITTYHGPTAHLGTRISARTAPTSVTRTVWIGRSYEHDADEDHRRAAAALKSQLGWDGEMVGGSLTPDKMVWVFTGGCSPVIRDEKAPAERVHEDEDEPMRPAPDPETLCQHESGCERHWTVLEGRPEDATDRVWCAEHAPPAPTER